MDRTIYNIHYYVLVQGRRHDPIVYCNVRLHGWHTHLILIYIVVIVSNIGRVKTFCTFTWAYI